VRLSLSTFVGFSTVQSPHLRMPNPGLNLGFGVLRCGGPVESELKLLRNSAGYEALDLCKDIGIHKILLKIQKVCNIS
jgi:hypothetical protein